MCACIAADEDQLNALFANARSRAGFFFSFGLCVYIVRTRALGNKLKMTQKSKLAQLALFYDCVAHEVRVVLCLCISFQCVRGCDTDFAGKETDSKLLCSVCSVSWCVFMCVKHAHLVK